MGIKTSVLQAKIFTSSQTIQKGGHLESTVPLCHFNYFIIIIIMNNQGENNTLLQNKIYPQSSSIASSTNQDFRQETCGHPNLDPIWIQTSKDTWSEISFDPAFRLQSIPDHSSSATRSVIGGI